MACVRIKAERKSSDTQALIRKARTKAARLLEAADRVLVVFEGEAAKIYYEREGQLPSSSGRTG